MPQKNDAWQEEEIEKHFLKKSGKKRQKMKVSGKKVFALKRLINNKHQSRLIK
jgi:hypothetical protein